MKAPSELCGENKYVPPALCMSPGGGEGDINIGFCPRRVGRIVSLRYPLIFDFHGRCSRDRSYLDH